MDVLAAVLPVFILVALGALAARRRFFDAHFVQRANLLVYHVLLPALLFQSIATSNFRDAFSGPLVGGAYLATVTTFLLALAACAWSRLSPGEKGSFLQGTFRGNLAYVGLPIVLGAVGEANLPRAAVLTGTMVPLFNALGVIALLLPHRATEPRGWAPARRLVAQLSTNPLILSSMLGLLWSVCRLPIPGLAGSVLSLLSQATLPLSLLCLGGAFTVKGALSSMPLASLGSVAKLVVLPALALGFFRGLGLSGDELQVGTIMMGCPTAVVTYVMASQLRGSVELSGSIVILSTAASALTITGWLILLRALAW